MALTPHPDLARLAWWTLGLTLLVIIWGAFVRASGSGAGCGEHWPLCNGAIVPTSPTVQTLIELTHRVTSGLSLLAALWLYGRCRARLIVGAIPRKAAGWTLVFFVIEALIGAALVKFRLVEGDTSAARAVVIGLHLVNTFLLLFALTWTALSLRSEGTLGALDRRQQLLLSVGAAALLAVGASGGVTALGDTLFPATSLAEGVAQDLSPTAHFLVKLRVWHPVLAVLTSLYWIALATTTRRRYTQGSVHRAALAVSAVVTAQIVCGVVNLVLLAPTWMQLTHLALADTLWLTVVWLIFEVHLSSQQERTSEMTSLGTAAPS